MPEYFGILLPQESLLLIVDYWSIEAWSFASCSCRSFLAEELDVVSIRQLIEAPTVYLGKRNWTSRIRLWNRGMSFFPPLLLGRSRIFQFWLSIGNSLKCTGKEKISFWVWLNPVLNAVFFFFLSASACISFSFLKLVTGFINGDSRSSHTPRREGENKMPTIHLNELKELCDEFKNHSV